MHAETDATLHYAKVIKSMKLSVNFFAKVYVPPVLRYKYR